MNSVLKNILLIVNTLALVASIIWFIVEPGFEPIITALLLIAALVGLWITDTTGKNVLKQKQRGGDNSENYQAGGNITIKK